MGRGYRTIETTTLTLFRLDGTASRLWALGMMGAGRPALARMPGLTFWKLCGTGAGVGFTPRLDMAKVGILAVWSDAQAARDAIEAERGVFARYRRRSVESVTFHLAARGARGKWSGRQPFAAQTSADTPGPLAVLTRATLRPRALSRFWPQTPGVSDAIAANDDVMFQIGLAEVPFLQQITFSIWPDAASMTRFAHAAGPHASAVRAVRRGDWFREELYARFTVTDCRGDWSGIRHPILPEAHAA